MGTCIQQTLGSMICSHYDEYLVGIVFLHNAHTATAAHLSREYFHIFLPCPSRYNHNWDPARRCTGTRGKAMRAIRAERILS